MNATTIERVKRFLPEANRSTEEDALIADIIASTTVSLEQWLRRKFEVVAHTQTFDWMHRRTRLWLPAYPVEASPELELRYDPDHAFGSDTVIDSENYVLALEEGVIYFDRWSPFEGYQVVRITWTGGMAATVDDLEADYPSVVHAATLQVVHEFRRRRRLDMTSLSIGGASVGVAGEMGLLKRVEDLLQPFRREAVNA